MEYRVPGSGRLPGYTLRLVRLSISARVFATKPGLTQLRVSEPRAPSVDEAQVLCPVESYRGALPGEILVRIVIARWFRAITTQRRLYADGGGAQVRNCREAAEQARARVRSAEFFPLRPYVPANTARTNSR